MVHNTLIVKLFVLTQMLKKKVALFTYQVRPNHLLVKTYVNMKMVRKSQREILKMARKMASELVGMRMVR